MIDVNAVELKPGVHWVGGVDWDIRNFHGYSTDKGTTYNAYLIMDEKIVLVDTVKHNLYDEMMDRIRRIVDPAKIDIVVANHVEMDHSGSLPRLLEVAEHAKVVCSPNGEKGLRAHYGADWDFHVARSGDTLNIGKRTLTFVNTPMVHWPDSMVTYIAEDKLLLPNDAFGQHLACPYRFDDEVPWGQLLEQAQKYYGNIVLPYGDQVKKALEAVDGLDIDMIGPSHGIIWRSRIKEILAEYAKWANHDTEMKALIVYDSMWGSTTKLAYALAEGLGEEGVPVRLMNLGNTHMSDVITHLLTSRLILIGSPTLNNGMLPSIGGFLTYVRGLRPRRRTGFAFGSFGWGGQAVGEIEKVMEELGWEQPRKGISVKWRPTGEDLSEVKAAGKELGGLLRGH